MANIYSCYGSGCPNERADGECRFHGNVRKCPVETPEDELEEDEFWREYWAELKFEEQRGN